MKLTKSSTSGDRCYDSYLINNGLEMCYKLGTHKGTERATLQSIQGEIGMGMRQEYEYEYGAFIVAFKTLNEFKEFMNDGLGCFEFVIKLGKNRMFVTGNQVILNINYDIQDKKEVETLLKSA